MQARPVVVLLDRAERQFEGVGGDQRVLLVDRVDLQRHEVEQLGVAEGRHPQAFGPTVGTRLEHIEDAFEEYIGSGHQGVGQVAQALEQLLHQAASALAAEHLGMLDDDLAAEVLQRLAEAGGAVVADDQVRPRAEQGDMARRRLQQGFGEAARGVLVVADHRGEALRVELAVDGHHRQAFGDQPGMGIIPGRQATGDDQRVAAARAEQVDHLALGLRLVVGAGDQQLVAARPGALFELLGEAGVAGVFQVREDEAEGAGLPAAQAGGLLVRLVAVFLDHGKHALDGGGADAPLGGLAIDDVAGGGHRDPGQAGDITEFQTDLYWRRRQVGLQGSIIIG